MSAQLVTPTMPIYLQIAIMAALAGLKDAKPNTIIKDVLQDGLQKDSNAVVQEFVNYGCGSQACDPLEWNTACR